MVSLFSNSWQYSRLASATGQLKRGIAGPCRENVGVFTLWAFQGPCVWVNPCLFMGKCVRLWAPLTVSVCDSPERSYRMRAGDSLRKLRLRHWAKFGTGFFYTRTGYFLFKKYLPVLENGLLSFGQTQPSSCNLTSSRVSRFSVRANDIKVCIIVDLNENSLFEGQLIKFSSDLISILPQTHKKSNQRRGR